MYVIVFANLGIFKLESLLKCYLILIRKRSHFEKFFLKYLLSLNFSLQYSLEQEFWQWPQQ